MSTDLARLEEQKIQLLKGLEVWSAERLNVHPVEGGWSALQVVDHLIKTERHIQNRVREGLAAPHRLGLRDRLGTAFLTRIFRSDRRVKVPKSASAVLPDAAPDLPTLLSQWDRSRAELAALLAALTPAQQTTGVFRHPVGGWMSVPGVLTFFSVHMHHHNFQLNRLQEAHRNAADPA